MVEVFELSQQLKWAAVVEMHFSSFNITLIRQPFCVNALTKQGFMISVHLSSRGIYNLITGYDITD